MLNTGKLAGKTLYISGASRGIGKAIALKAAKDGARIVVAAKTADPHPKLPGTIYTAAKEIEAAGGEALPLVVDIRNEDNVQDSIEKAVKHFGGIDIVVNNASAISLTNTEVTPMKKYDLMHSINTRGTYVVSKLALPYLKTSKNNPHILNISPPLNMNPRWFRDHVAYTMAKYGMSMCVLGMSEEFRGYGIGVNALWPKTAIITAAMEMLGGGSDIAKECRLPDIMSDAAYVMLTKDARNYTGQFVVDEDVLREVGVTDFDPYAAVKGTKDFMPDFFLDDFLAYEEKVGAIKDRQEQIAKKSTPCSKSEAAAGGSAGVDAVFEKLKEHLSEEVVSKTKAVYVFDVKDTGVWWIDLKNGSGASGKGQPPVDADTTFTLSEPDFQDLFAGKLKPASAFMSGKLKLKGDMGKALALDKLMGKLNKRGLHTSASRHDVASTAPDKYESVDQVFSRIAEVANADVVAKVNSTYLFDVEEGGKYFIDLKNGEGKVDTSGEVGEAADATIKINQANLLRLFNRELKPATAFMTGQLKLSGDLSKAMALEAVMKASRGEKAFHTSAYRATDAPPAMYKSPQEVFTRVKSVASEDIVKQVQAIYMFDVENEGQWFIDFKNAPGDAGEGSPGDKPDVTIKMNNEIFLKIFNRELSAANAFMTGKIKVSGDLAKALTLEKVMKAAREAAEREAAGK